MSSMSRRPWTCRWGFLRACAKKGTGLLNSRSPVPFFAQALTRPGSGRSRIWPSARVTRLPSRWKGPSGISTAGNGPSKAPAAPSPRCDTSDRDPVGDPLRRRDIDHARSKFLVENLPGQAEVEERPAEVARHGFARLLLEDQHVAALNEDAFAWVLQGAV